MSRSVGISPQEQSYVVLPVAHPTEDGLKHIEHIYMKTGVQLRRRQHLRHPSMGSLPARSGHGRPGAPASRRA
jgi:hypothetical protein